VPWISKKRKEQLETAAGASGWGGEAPFLAEVDGRIELTWPEGAKYVLISRSLLEQMVGKINKAAS
jgi:hypothetical protein